MGEGTWTLILADGSLDYPDEVLERFGHPGGPFCRKDPASWSIPKGLIPRESLPSSRQSASLTRRPVITARAVKHCRLAKPGSLEARPFTCGRWNDWDPAGLQSNMFEMEWPPRSGRR